jgi:microcystin-dependent protein
MSDQFIAEIRIFPFNFAPTEWAFCQGQLLSISENTALFSVLGTNYGGDGRVTFGLPNLQGSIAMHTTQFSSSPFGQFVLGQDGGDAAVTLSTSQIPSHTHSVQGDNDNNNATAGSPAGAVPVNATPILTFSKASAPQVATMNALMVAVAGGNQPHNNLMPYLVLSYCIALGGIYPSR